MIQRIQSVYLGIAVLLILASLGLFCANTFLASENTTTTYLTFSKSYCVLGYAFSALLLLAAVLTAFCIFQFKKRLKQIKTVLYAQMAIIAAYVAYIVPFVHNTKLSLEFDTTLILPILAFAFQVLARKAIVKDEKLVRAADRIR